VNRKIRKIVIVGGGTAGWMTAVSLARMSAGLPYSIVLVESEEIGTVGVGEATIPPISAFNSALQIDEQEFMRATQATFKLGIEFADWYRRGQAYMHPFGQFGVEMHGISFHHFWLRHRAQGGKTESGVFNVNMVTSYSGRYGRLRADHPGPLPPTPYAFHFDAGLYAAFLRRLAEAAGVKRFEGKIVHVQQNAADGFIESVKLEDGRVVPGDLYIDCSGFRGLLIEQTLHAGYEDWSRWLPCDRAMAVPCERVSATTPYTRATAREAGWQWRIPLQHRTGNGYVYCSQFLGDDEAARLLVDRLDGEPLAEPRPLRFLAGRRREIWKKNVVAIGLSSGFLEPLESTSIHLIQSAIARLLSLFPREGFEQVVVDKFNTLAYAELEQIRDILVLHYTATARDDTPFWRHCRAIERPESLLRRCELYQRTGAIHSDAGDIFKVPSWFSILEGQGLPAQAWHPFADIPSDTELARRFDLLSSEVLKCVRTFPLHDDYIRAHCAAAPIRMKSRKAGTG
jgi:tryptophan 7-halogenase